jgi:salicylate hydroxylase
MLSPLPLNIIITGAGIAGLAAAASLRRAGHNVTLYERSSLNNEIGAAIHLCPNASRALIPWGLNAQRARFVTAKCAFRANGVTAKVFHDDDMSGIEARFGAPWYWCHRVDLHTELKRLACGEEGAGRPARVVLKSEVRDYVSGHPGDGSRVGGCDCSVRLTEGLA